MSYPGSWVKFLCWLIFSVHSTQHCHSGLIKTPVILSKRRWQVTPKHAYTLYPMNLEGADHAVLAVWEPITEENEFTRNLSGNIWPQLSQLAEPLWTDPGLRSGNWWVQADLHWRGWVGINLWTFPRNPHMWGKSHLPKATTVVSKAIWGTILKDTAEHVWAFLRVQITCWTELNMENLTICINITYSSLIVSQLNVCELEDRIVPSKWTLSVVAVVCYLCQVVSSCIVKLVSGFKKLFFL